ncbi:hypothetical protein Tco_1048851, partial [Tanacetum coccineum]
LKLVIKRSKTQTHRSHASGSGTYEGTDDIPGVPDVPTYKSDDEQISCKSSEEDDKDEVNVNEENHDDDDDEQTDSDNDGDDFVHPKFLTHDDEARQEEVNKEDSFDPRVQTPSHVESTDDKGMKKVMKKDVNVNLKGRDTVTTDASLPNVQATQETEDTHVILTAPINSEDVPVTTIAELPLAFATTLPLPPTYATNTSSHINNRFKLLPTKSSKHWIFIQSGRLREEAQAKNEDFLNKLNDNIKKITKDQVKEQVKAQVSKILPKIEKLVNDQLESKVLIRSSNETKTSHAIGTNMSELELKKILIDKMEANKSINRPDI